jgi:hypothetical protein
MRSLLICTRGNDTVPRIFDIFEEIRETSIPSNTPFISCLLNWFGKTLGIKLFPKQRNHEDLWACVNELTSPLSFHWPINRWSRMKPDGPLVISFIKSFLIQMNALVTTPSIERICSIFTRDLLNEEMINATNFYAKAQSSELDKTNPFEMEEFVMKSEKHFQNSLRIFTQSTCEALFNHQVIGEVENYLQYSIHNHFRNLWLENSQNSEDYCQNIFESCFKWVKALIGSTDKPTESEIKNRFQESLKIYLQHAKGTKKFQVLCFCTKIYLDIISSLYPKFQKVCDSIMYDVDELTMEENIKMNEKRIFLQNSREMNMKLQLIENTIHRLNEGISARKIQQIKSDEFFEQRNTKLLCLGVKLSNENQEIRNRFIKSEESSLKEEIQQFREIDQTLEEYKKNYSFKQSCK